MDLSLAFVSSVLAEGKTAFRKVAEKGVRTEFLFGHGRDAMEYVISHLTDYGQLPTADIIAGKTGIELPPPEGSADFFIDEILNIRLHDRLTAFGTNFTSLLNERKPQEAFQVMQKVLLDLRLEKLGSAPASSLLQLGQAVIERYDDMKAGKRGIPFPWPSVTESTLGMWPGDLILIAARLGIGKTWSLLQIARSAWDAGARVLLATTEMTQERMADRFFALHLTLPYSQFRRGQLLPLVEKKMRDSIYEMMAKDDNRIHIIGGDFDFRIENLAATIDEVMPEIVVLDGAYLIQSEGANRNEQAANAFNNLKRLANKTKIPFCVSSQFNREVKKNSPNSVQAESIGLTDVAGWNADAAFGLYQTEDMGRDKRMGMKPLKIREGKGEDIELIWDIENMVFKELPRSDQSNGGGGSDPFGSGMPTNAVASPDDQSTIF
jgi:replicative DNA helicase